MTLGESGWALNNQSWNDIGENDENCKKEGKNDNSIKWGDDWPKWGEIDQKSIQRGINLLNKDMKSLRLMHAVAILLGLASVDAADLTPVDHSL